MEKSENTRHKGSTHLPHDEVYVIDGVKVHLHYAKESDPVIMERLEKLLWENSITR